MNRSRRITVFLICVGLGLGAASALAEEPPAPVDPIQKELEWVRKMLANAQSKFTRGGAMGMDDGETPGNRVPTPAEACCMSNLEHLDKSLRKIRDLLKERSLCFEEKRDVPSLDSVNLVQQQVRNLAGSIRMFAEAKENLDVDEALNGAKKSYNLLKRSVELMTECKAGTPAASSGD